MTTHNLTIQKVFADAILSGEKTFEIRENNYGFQKGDMVVFTIIDRLGADCPSHPLSNIPFRITYVLNGWGLKNGFVVFGIKEDTIC